MPSAEGTLCPGSACHIIADTSQDASWWDCSLSIRRTVLDHVAAVDDNLLIYYSLHRLECQRILFEEQDQVVKCNVEQKSLS